ncbi:hypothetical protein C5S31_10415 [ANME-1 cluster archaeon GoMg2]|nr:hypothetical protein [ANME-1 cluster archaeon GoMg2]
MSKIIFYHPPTDAKNVYSDTHGKEQIWPPHGILCVGGIVPENWEQVLVDGRLYTDGGESTIKKEVNSADVLACSVMTGKSIKYALSVSKLAKDAGLQVIWGGPHPTIFPEETLSCPYIDIIITGGCAEGTFSKWVNSFEKGRKPVDIHGIGYKNGNNISYIPPLFPNLSTNRDLYPSPNMCLIKDFSKYLNSDNSISEKTISHVTSVGCPYACIFCCEPALSGRKWIHWSAKKSFFEIKRLLNLSGATGIKFHDALFFVDLKRAIDIALSIKNLKIKWGATMHPTMLDTMSEEKLKLLQNCGLSRVMVGLESGNQDVVNMVGKKFNVRRVPLMAKKLSNVGIVGMFTFIVGFPKAPKEEYKDTINTAEMIYNIWDQHQIKIHFASPWPGTKLWELSSTLQNFTYPQALEDWATYDYYLPQQKFHDKTWEAAINEINKKMCPYYHSGR